jgi:hypothetical protein
VCQSAAMRSRDHPSAKLLCIALSLTHLRTALSAKSRLTERLTSGLNSSSQVFERYFRALVPAPTSPATSTAPTALGRAESSDTRTNPTHRSITAELEHTSTIGQSDARVAVERGVADVTGACCASTNPESSIAAFAVHVRRATALGAEGIASHRISGSRGSVSPFCSGVRHMARPEAAARRRGGCPPGVHAFTACWRCAYDAVVPTAVVRCPIVCCTNGALQTVVQTECAQIRVVQLPTWSKWANVTLQSNNWQRCATVSNGQQSLAQMGSATDDEPTEKHGCTRFRPSLLRCQVYLRP